MPRRWVRFDLDRLPAPRGVDLRDGASAAAIARATLPPEFHPAGCWWQQTSGAGIKPGLNLRLGFWLDRPVGQAVLDRWLVGAPIDASVFRPVQPIYVAPPILKGVADPVPVRTGLLRGRDDTVAVPDLPPVAPKIAHPSHSPDCRRCTSAATPRTGRAAGWWACAGPWNWRHPAHGIAAWYGRRRGQSSSTTPWPWAEIAAALLAAARAAGLDEADAGTPAADQERLPVRHFRPGSIGMNDYAFEDAPEPPGTQAERGGQPWSPPPEQPWPASLAAELFTASRARSCGRSRRRPKPTSRVAVPVPRRHRQRARRRVVGPGRSRPAPPAAVRGAGRAHCKGRKGTSWGRVRELLEARRPGWAEARIASGLSSGEG